MAKIIRITTVPIALKVLLKGQMRYMKNAGFEVIMVSADGHGLEGLEAAEECPHYIIPMTRKITPFKDIHSLWKLYRFLRSQKPDIVHSHTPKAGLLAMLAGKLAGVKIRIHTVAGLRFMTASGMSRKLLVAMEKLTCKWATQVWPNSFSLLEYIKKNKLVSEKRMEVIGLGSSNGIDLKRFSPSSLQQDKLQEIKKAIQFEEPLTYLLCVGRIVKDKGVEELLKAFTRVYENDKSLRLVLVGPFEDELDPVSDEARKILKEHPAVILTGWSENVEYYMSFSFALLHPSHREGFPNVLLQAGAMLCPVICSRIEGNVDIVEHERTGLLFEAKNEEDLFQQLEKALGNPQLIKQYAAQLRVKIEQHFDQPAVHDLIAKKYRQLLAQ